MSDTADHWNDHKDWRKSSEGQDYHAKRRERAINNIKKCPSIQIDSIKNDDEHYILKITPDNGQISIVDFWPSTLKWSKRKSKASGEGVGRMLAYFKIKHGEKA